MGPVYRGEIKLQGRSLRGWLANAEDPAERVPFELVIDGEARGYYLADRPYLSLERFRALGDGAHGFALQLDREWISGGEQNVTLVVEGAATGVELHAPLGPAANAYFDDGSGDATVKRTREESEALRDLAEFRVLRKSAPTENERADYYRRYFEVLDGLSRKESPGSEWRHSILLAQEHYNIGQFTEAADAAERVLSVEPDVFRALLVKGRALIALNHAAEARELFLRAQALQPDSPIARAYIRTANTLALDETRKGPLTLGTLIVDANGAIAGANGTASLAERIAQLPFDWLRFTHDPYDFQHSADATAALNAPLMQRVGCTNVGPHTYWRREALAGLGESGLLPRLDDAERWMSVYAASTKHVTARRKVALVARDASEVGVLHRLAAQYDAMGNEPLLWYAGEAAAETRRFVLEKSVSLVHALSGTGYAVAGALAFTNIPFIYGVHSAADMLSETDDSTDEEDGASTPRREFDFVLSHATQIYATSADLRDAVEQYFDVRCPVLAEGGRQ